MSDNVIQASFSAGELSPSLFARVDFAKYHSGAATMRNFFVDYRSGASTRPGTEFIRPCPPPPPNARLVRFQQSVNVTYILEFGNNYLRFITQGASVVLPQYGILSITQASLALVTLVSPLDTTGWQNGDLIFISGVTFGMPQVNNRYFVVSNLGPDYFTLTDATTGAGVDSTNFDPYGGQGFVQRVYTISTPYTSDELALLKFSQNASVMNITHPNHPPYLLTLINATNWTLVPATIGSTVGAPTLNPPSSSGTGAAYYKYAITAVDTNNQEGPPSNIGLLGGVLDLRTSQGSNSLSWTSPGGPIAAYNIYGASPSFAPQTLDVGGLGFMGIVDSNITTFFDSNISPDFSKSPPVHENPFATTNPAVSSYFQQRLIYANGGGNLVATLWASKVGAPYNFDISNPSQADDSITATLVSLEVNEIKSLVPMPTGLIVLTTHGAWQVNGGAGGVATQGGPITPTTIIATPQAYVGANDVPPILVNYDILYVQVKGSIIRDLTYNIYSNIYTGNDISVLSSHLFYGHQILEWAYAEEPFKVIWCVREDGTLLSLTLVKEQDMYGWARHDTLGNFKSVATVTEGQFDATYFVVQRPNPNPSIGGNILQIERLHERQFEFGAEDGWCVDAGVATDHTFPNATLSIGSPSGQLINLATNPGVFTNGMNGWVIRAGGGIIVIQSITNANLAIANVIQTVTDVLPNDPLNRPKDQGPGLWTLDKPFTKVYGLSHLEGQQIAVLADGGVIRGMTVSGGSITLPAPATKVIAGYGFQAQLQTMYLDLGQETNTIQGKRKKVGALTVRVKDSRGIKAGRTFNLVTPIKELNRVTQLGLPVQLVTADERIIMDPLWDVPGQICLQVDDPLPSTVLGVIPEIVVGDTPK